MPEEKSIILPKGERLLSFSTSPRGDLVFLTRKRRCGEAPKTYNIFVSEMIKDTGVLTFSSDIEKIIVVQES